MVLNPSGSAFTKWKLLRRSRLRKPRRPKHPAGRSEYSPWRSDETEKDPAARPQLFLAGYVASPVRYPDRRSEFVHPADRNVAGEVGKASTSRHLVDPPDQGAVQAPG